MLDCQSSDTPMDPNINLLPGYLWGAIVI